MEKYPGVEVEPFDISTNELLEKRSPVSMMPVSTLPMVHIKDQDGTLYKLYSAAQVL